MCDVMAVSDPMYEPRPGSYQLGRSADYIVCKYGDVWMVIKIINVFVQKC